MKKRNWEEIHRWDKKERAVILQRLTVNKSFKILQDMYELAYSIKGYDRKQASMFHEEKIKVLANVHKAFNKVKS